MKTATLTGADLNRAVAMALGSVWQPPTTGQCGIWVHHRAGKPPTYSIEAQNYAGDIAVSAQPVHLPAGVLSGDDRRLHPLDVERAMITAHQAEHLCLLIEKNTAAELAYAWSVSARSVDRVRLERIVMQTRRAIADYLTELTEKETP